MTESQTLFNFDEKSNIWIEAFSTILSCLFPVEYVYGEWFWWQGENKARHANSEDIFCSQSGDLETGSRVEGFCVPRFFISKSNNIVFAKSFEENVCWQPDLDVMTEKESFVEKEGTVVPIFEVEHVTDNPRYAKLRLTEKWKKVRPQYKNTTFLHHAYLLPAGDDSLPSFLQTSSSGPYSNDLHGPVRKLLRHGFPGYESDETHVFKYPIAWPERSMEWLVRSRQNGWPSAKLVKEIFESGCHLAPVGRGKRFEEPVDLLQYVKNPESAGQPKMVENALGHIQMSMDETEWRISFSLAENKLGQSMTPIQRHVLILMKIIKKFYLPDLVVSSYHLKNILFWESETREESFWREDNTAACLTTMLDRLQDCLEKRRLPHYIMPESNLFEGENEAKLAEAATAVADVRKSLLHKVVCMLKRLHSMTYLSPTFLRDLDLQPYFVKIEDRNLSEEERTQLLCSLNRLFVQKYIDVLVSLQKVDESNTHKLFLVPLYAYQSLLARKLAKLWFLDNCASEMKSDEKMFTKFVENEVADLSSGKNFIPDDFLALSLTFFTQMNQGQEPSLLVCSSRVMDLTKEVQCSVSRELFEKAKAPFKEITDRLNRSELTKVADSIKIPKDSLDTVTNEDIWKTVEDELKIPFEELRDTLPHQ